MLSRRPVSTTKSRWSTTAGRVATTTDPQEWQLHPVSETVPIAHWPKVPELNVAAAVTLPAPTLSDLGALEAEFLAIF